ncbi:MAG: RNA polymerase sigma-70 factor [Chitinophagaceae bacterium]|nr:RNA polymerase sigma-70 factor [Chitinophagaceae bacterium]
MSALSQYELQTLFNQVANSDVAAFRQVFDLYNKRLFAAVLKLTKSGYAAEELVQEIFTSVWESRDHLQNLDNPSAYIFTIAYNKTFRFLKKVSSNDARLNMLMKRAEEQHNPTEEWFDMREAQLIVEHAIRQLSPQRQLIYRMSREEGLSYEQIAAALNISKFTVKKQMAVSLKQLRKIVSQRSPLILLLLL